jgi:hypothetical protein
MQLLGHLLILYLSIVTTDVIPSGTLPPAQFLFFLPVSVSPAEPLWIYPMHYFA